MRYDPAEHFNQGSNNYEMMEKAKELRGLPEARMEHLVKLKIEMPRTATASRRALQRRAREAIKLIISTQETWEAYARGSKGGIPRRWFRVDAYSYFIATN